MIGAPLAGILAAAGAGGKPIEYVGGTTGGQGGTTSSWTVSLTSLTGGIASAPAAGDFVLVFYGSGAVSNTAIAVETAGYTNRADLYVDASRDTRLVVESKTLAVAETSVTLSQNFYTNGGVAAVVLVFRNVDAASPMDVAVQTATSTQTVRPDPPAITPVTPGAWVVAGGAGAHNNVSESFSSTDLSDFRSVQGDDGIDLTLGAGHVVDPSATVNPAQFTYSDNDVSGGAFTSAAVTLALRPAS